VVIDEVGEASISSHHSPAIGWPIQQSSSSRRIRRRGMIMRMRNLTLAVAGLCLLVCCAPAQARDAFVGQWKVTITPDDDAARAGQKEYKDTLTFKANQFKSKACEAHGFKAAEYEEDTRAGLVATFKATVKSEKEGGKAVWTGTSTGQDITGEMTWTKKDGTELKYTFKGARQANAE
jgi:hypothetical protein